MRFAGLVGGLNSRFFWLVDEEYAQCFDFSGFQLHCPTAITLSESGLFQRNIERLLV